MFIQVLQLPVTFILLLNSPFSYLAYYLLFLVINHLNTILSIFSFYMSLSWNRLLFKGDSKINSPETIVVIRELIPPFVIFSASYCLVILIRQVN